LRDEFFMADEAFALSPISARAAQPSDADYAAISEAFMETSRGRWFLNEYARRNRNADTSMVLDAVARIEENLTEQKQVISEDGMAEALASIRRSVDEARTAALQDIDGRAFVESAGAIRKGTRVIREIAWRLREIGADGRICDLIALQIDAIETACAEIASIDSDAVLNGAFDLIEKRIASFGGGDTASDPVVVPQPADPSMTAADTIHDDAVLEQVAMEMGAPDAAMPAPAETGIVVPVAALQPEATSEPSLGESLIASGVVRRPMPSITDPFAAIRRLSQAEKIAFFS
jgi:hypothetical protein